MVPVQCHEPFQHDLEEVQLVLNPVWVPRNALKVPLSADVV